MTEHDDKPLGRYVRVLEEVAASNTGLTLTEIAREMGLQPASVHRLVHGLVNLGLLQRSSGSKGFMLGFRLQALLQKTMNLTGYGDLARSALDQLVNEFGETAHLAQLKGDVAESVLMAQPVGSGRTFVQPGRQLPLHAAASGKAILAFQDPDFIARFMTRPREQFTSRTKIGQTEILRELEQIRAEGMAVCDNELDAGVLSYGQPVRVRGGHVLYSVGITGLADRFCLIPRTRVRDRLSEVAAILSERLGFET